MTEDVFRCLGFLFLGIIGFSISYIVFTDGELVGTHGGSTSHPLIDFFTGILLLGGGIYGIFRCWPWRNKSSSTTAIDKFHQDLNSILKYWRSLIGIIVGLFIGFLILFADKYIPEDYVAWFLPDSTLTKTWSPMNSLTEFYLALQIFAIPVAIFLFFAFFVYRKIGVWISVAIATALTPLLVYIDILRTERFIRENDTFQADKFAEKMGILLEFHITGVIFFLVVFLFLKAFSKNKLNKETKLSEK